MEQIKYFCDWCGKELTKDTKIREKLGYRVVRLLTMDMTTPFIEWDICNECLREFKLFKQARKASHKRGKATDLKSSKGK
jgi:DNA-directed RNA polymerase subunit RPC12/RpoP